MNSDDEGRKCPFRWKTPGNMRVIEALLRSGETNVGRSPKRVRRITAGKRGVEEVQVFRLPSHRGVDASAAAPVIEKYKLLERRGIELAIFAEKQVGFRSAIRLPGCVQTENIGLVFLGARVGVANRSGQKTEYGQNQSAKGKTAKSLVPRICQRTAQRASARSNAQRRSANSTAITIEKKSIEWYT